MFYTLFLNVQIDTENTGKIQMSWKKKAMCWLMPRIPALGSLRQEDCQKSEATK